MNLIPLIFVFISLVCGTRLLKIDTLQDHYVSIAGKHINGRVCFTNWKSKTALAVHIFVMNRYGAYQPQEYLNRARVGRYKKCIEFDDELTFDIFGKSYKVKFEKVKHGKPNKVLFEMAPRKSVFAADQTQVSPQPVAVPYPAAQPHIPQRAAPVPYPGYQSTYLPQAATMPYPAYQPQPPPGYPQPNVPTF